MQENESIPNITGRNGCVDIVEYWSQFTFDWTDAILVRILVGVVYVLIFLVGVIGNASVIIRVINDRKLHSAQYIFLLNLMASDFMLCLTSVPFSPVAILMKHWIFGGVLCKAIPLCQAMSVVITSLSLTAIAIDKYVHITDATRGPMALGQALLVVGCIWTVSAALSLPLVLSYEVKEGSAYFSELGVSFCGKFCDEWSTLEYRKIYGTSVMCIQFVVPMFIIAYCYASIMLKVQRDMMIENKQFVESLSTDQRIDAMRTKKKVTFILILMVVAFIGSWAPLTFFNILRDYDHVPSFVKSQPYFWALIVNSTAMSTVIWNPLLFFWLTGAKHRPRSASLLADSAIVSFLLAFNPLRMIFKRNRQSAGSSLREAGSVHQSSTANFSQASSTKRLTTSRSNIRNARSVSFGKEHLSVKKESLSPPIMITPSARKSPNLNRRSLPSSLECYCLLSKPSPRAPKVTNESLSDVSSLDLDEEITENKETFSSSTEEGGALIKKETRPKDRKSTIYLHLGKSSNF